MFRCIKKDTKGFIQENLLREGNSEAELLEGLEMFNWPSVGKWEISNAQEIEMDLDERW